MVHIKEVADNIYLIDNQLYCISQWGSVYLANEDKKALIDTGPTTSSNTVREALKQLGVRPEDIDYLVATHIHLDHSGGAGTLLKEMPRSQVLVHSRGAKHLVNPAKLVSSAMEAQGKDALARTGEVVPIDEKRIKVVYDGDIIRLSEKQSLQMMDAPGHAQHELCIYETRNKGIFTGDAAGILLAEGGLVFPSTPPPNFDLELYIGTLKRLMKLNATRLYFAHFGITDRVQENLDLVIARLNDWNEIVSLAVKGGKADGAVTKILAQAGAILAPLKQANTALYEHLLKHSIADSATGFVRYYKQKHTLN